MSLTNEKSIHNVLCASNGCDRTATKRILFSLLGFSACFCQKCADELIQNNIGIEEAAES
jgi:hypothetical protein